MKTMTQARRASAALRAASDAGALQGSLIPAVFGCPYGHAARITASPLPFGRCGDCGAEMTVLDPGALPPERRRAG